jgi:hypothetical protein
MNVSYILTSSIFENMQEWRVLKLNNSNHFQSILFLFGFHNERHFHLLVLFPDTYIFKYSQMIYYILYYNFVTDFGFLSYAYIQIFLFLLGL